MIDFENQFHYQNKLLSRLLNIFFCFLKIKKPRFWRMLVEGGGRGQS